MMRQDTRDQIKQIEREDPARVYAFILTDAPEPKGHELHALCPLHPDHDPSLRIETRGDKAGLWRCDPCGEGGDVFKLAELALGWDFATAIERLADKLGLDRAEAPAAKPRKTSAKPEAPKPYHGTPTYLYRDEAGAVLFGVVRTPEKDFWQVRPDGNDGWFFGLDGVRRVLYRLPETLAAVRDGVTVWICEGEKDADNLAGQGFAATTSPQGAKNWRPEYAEALKGADVICLPDNDPDGQAYAADVCASLHGIASRVRVLNLPDLPPKGDVSDFLADLGTVDDLKMLAEVAPDWKPPEVPGSSGESVVYRHRWTDAELLACEFREPRWVVPGVIPEGLTLLAGRPKVGKSWLTLSIALAKKTGGKVLGHDVEPGPVLYLALEDGDRRIRDRMHALDWPAEDERTQPVVFLTAATPEDLRRELDTSPYDLVIVDTVSRFFLGTDWNDQAAVTGALSDLHRLATEREVPIVAVDHLRKGLTGDVMTDVMGSTAKVGVADTAAAIYKDRGQREATLQVDGRDIEYTELRMYFDRLTLCWQPAGEKQTTHQAEILESLADGPAALAEISRRTGLDKGNLSRELVTLAERGHLKDLGGGRYGP